MSTPKDSPLTASLKSQREAIKAQIVAKLAEISKDDEDLKKLYAALDDVNDQLGPSMANDQIILDRTDRSTDASRGTSAR